jgi:hypothetical protein
MDPNLDTHWKNTPVPQEATHDPEMDLRDPFDRWLWLADSLLGNVPPVPPSARRNVRPCRSPGC